MKKNRIKCLVNFRRADVYVCRFESIERMNDVIIPSFKYSSKENVNNQFENKSQFQKFKNKPLILLCCHYDPCLQNDYTKKKHQTKRENYSWTYCTHAVMQMAVNKSRDGKVNRHPLRPCAEYLLKSNSILMWQYRTWSKIDWYLMVGFDLLWIQVDASWLDAAANAIDASSNFNSFDWMTFFSSHFSFFALLFSLQCHFDGRWKMKRELQRFSIGKTSTT